MVKKKNFIILGLCISLVFMAVGYSILTQTLKINGMSDVDGVWKVRIASITPTSTSGKAVSKKTTISSNGKQATFLVDLFGVGDSVEYTVVVKNEGNIAAKITDVATNSANPNQHVKFDVDDISKNSTIEPSKSITFKARVYVDADSNSELTDQENIDFTLNIDFVQTKNKENVPVSPTPSKTVLYQGDISRTSDDSVRYRYYANGTIEIYGKGKTRDATLSYERLPVYTDIIINYLAEKGNISKEEFNCGTLLCKQIQAVVLYAAGHPKDEASFMESWNADNDQGRDFEWVLQYIPTLPKATSIIVKDGVTELGDVILSCSNVTSITVADTVYSIGEGAFSFSTINYIYLPDNQRFKTIPRQFCLACSDLKAISIPSTVTTIEETAFDTAYGFTNLIIPNSVETIGKNAFNFSGNASDDVLENVSFGTGLKTIKESAFKDRRKITSIIIPENVETIEKNAFYNTGLGDVFIYGTEGRFNSNAFPSGANISYNG